MLLEPRIPAISFEHCSGGGGAGDGDAAVAVAVKHVARTTAVTASPTIVASPKHTGCKKGEY
jgi:hypothetical protein